MSGKDDEIDIDVGKLPPPLPVDASAPPPPDDLPSYEHCYREYFFFKVFKVSLDYSICSQFKQRLENIESPSFKNYGLRVKSFHC